MMATQIIFILFSILIIGSAAYVLFTKSVVHGAFILLFAFLGVAGIFIFAAADFLAVAQIMIYVGGILVLLVFGVLLTHKSTQEKNNQLIVETKNYNRLLGGLVGVATFGVLVFVFSKINFTRLEGQHFEFFETPKTTVQSIGIKLITENSLPLEAVGILLLGALIGAGFLAKSSIQKS